MKNVFSAAFAVLLISGTTMAQNSVASLSKKEAKEERKEIRKSEVSFQSKQQFARDFPTSKNVKWKVTSNFDEATFNNNGIMTTAYYDTDSQLVGTTITKKFSDLPASAQKEIKKKYDGYNYGEVILFDDNEANDTDMILYGTSFEDEDNYFVPIIKNGQTTILKVKMDGEVAFFKKV